MKIEKGEWYYSVQCKACDTTIYFSHDPSRGMAEIAAHEDTHIELTCPACNQVEEYDRTELVSREAKYG
jgi:predicted nucleic-acid-binding Zn-ribbon protein